MVAIDSHSVRQAALLLHGLPLAARRQVLDQLDAVERRRLQPLLDELSELGIPAAAAGRATSLLPSFAPTPIERAAALSADAVARCLASCDAATAARLIGAHAWPWKVAVIEQMPTTRRASVLQCLRSDPPALAPAVRAYLCERLCAEAARLPAAGTPPGASWKRLIPWKR